MACPTRSLDEVRALFETNDIHTVDTAVADSQGHFRGKRVPVQRFLDVVAHEGVNIADAEVALATEHASNAHEVNDWERARFIEHS